MLTNQILTQNLPESEDIHNLRMEEPTNAIQMPGHDREEIPGFSATRYEGYELLRHWYREAVGTEIFHFLFECVSSARCRQRDYAMLRFQVLAEALGEEDTSRATAEIDAELRNKYGNIFWEAFQKGEKILRFSDGFPLPPEHQAHGTADAKVKPVAPMTDEELDQVKVGWGEGLDPVYDAKPLKHEIFTLMTYWWDRVRDPEMDAKERNYAFDRFTRLSRHLGPNAAEHAIAEVEGEDGAAWEDDNDSVDDPAAAA